MTVEFQVFKDDPIEEQHSIENPARQCRTMCSGWQTNIPALEQPELVYFLREFL